MGNFLKQLSTNLVLGGIPFNVNTSTYNHISKTSASNWSKQNRINNTPALQHSGTRTDTMSISGVKFPDKKTAEVTIAALKDMAISDKPQFLIGLDGLVYGKWAIDDIQEDEPDGEQSSYTINLSRYYNKSILGYAKDTITSLTGDSSSG
ncbi:phage tail protein [Thiotrichales bacterium 19S3-7]|nr:phage tail protein [Thiotrichales bacterium 19S3-7]MCF6802573.1 phage tail protein [Thiotrichales bacterium 19S3-11]